MDDIDTFHGGQAIRKRRLQAGLSREQLAERASIHEREIAEYEGNRCGIPTRHFQKLATAFGIHELELAWECSVVAIPGFEKTKPGKMLRSLTNDILERLKSESTSGSNGHPLKKKRKPANRKRVPA